MSKSVADFCEERFHFYNFNYTSMLTKYSVILLVLVLCVVQISSWKVWLRKSGAVIGAIVISQLTALPTNALTDPASMERFEAAQAELVNLDKNWDAIVQKQGDNVRRKLGTVYTPVSKHYFLSLEALLRQLIMLIL